MVIRIKDDGATSELPLVPIAASPKLRSAKLGAMYFGPQSESDISIILELQGTKSRYRTDNTFGVRLSSNGIQLKNDKLRIVTAIDNIPGGDRLHFYITTEELSWLANSRALVIESMNADSGEILDAFTFTVPSLKEFKKFAESVLMIMSTYN